MVNNLKHFTKANLTANQVYRVDVTEDFKRDNDNQPMNFLVVYNGGNAMILVQLNDNADERIPIPASGGRLVINKEDALKFHSIQLVDIGSGTTGTIYTTIGVL